MGASHGFVPAAALLFNAPLIVVVCYYDVTKLHYGCGRVMDLSL